MAKPGSGSLSHHVQDASSLEMIRAYVKYKEDRANRIRGEYSGSTGDPTSRTAVSSEFVLEGVRTELPQTLHIRKSIAVSRPRSGSSPSDSRAIDGRRHIPSKSSVVNTPVINGFRKSAQTLATQVEQLSSQLGLDRFDHVENTSRGETSVGRLDNFTRKNSSVSNGYTRPLVRGSRISSAQSATTGALSDVTEESESFRSRPPSAKSSVRTIGARAFPGRKQEDHSVERKRPDSKSSVSGNARLMENMQKLQEVNETLIVHLKKVMEAYKELDFIKANQEQDFTSKIAKMEQSLHAKDVQIVALQRDLEELASRSDEARSGRQKEAAQSQIVNAKLAQALQRVTRLQKENEELLNEQKSAREIQPSTERALLRKIMDLESELSRNRNKENEIEKLNSKLNEKDQEMNRILAEKNEEIRQISSAQLTNGTDSKQALRERELKQELEATEAARAGLVRELRDVKSELEEKTWRTGKYQKDMEKLVKEKDRAYEKMDEFQQEFEQKKQQERKAVESKLDAVADEMEGYKKRLKEADKYLAKVKVRQQELQSQHHQELLQLKTKMDELAATNKQYQEQLSKISSEIMAIDLDHPDAE
ncbi:hypothetical protein RvY_08001 [Ramazzottius varieornatus]|uniref:Uncharacterized protein n=1 Tax=Ramazzottius varieornatus TaxID=947166 RepID=A0A1D1VCG2_RAMVA|nr:hypothetical protein RvY_08001 [Ramazzottius varieornatus]